MLESTMDKQESLFSIQNRACLLQLVEYLRADDDTQAVLMQWYPGYHVAARVKFIQVFICVI